MVQNKPTATWWWRHNNITGGAHTIHIVPRWHIRLKLDISIAPCPLLPSQVLFMSSLLFSFLPRSSSSKFLVDGLSSFFYNPVSTFHLCGLVCSKHSSDIPSANMALTLGSGVAWSCAVQSFVHPRAGNHLRRPVVVYFSDHQFS